MDFPLLSSILLLPLLGIIIILFFPKKNEDEIKNFSIFITFVVFVLSLILLWIEDLSQVEETYNWIDVSILKTSYHLRVDGINLLLILLTTLLTPICLLASYRSIDKKVKEFNISFLLLETGIIGALLSYDLLLFYVFWELMLIPMYLIIGIWGSERRIYAAVKFFIFTMSGSLLMFIAILYLYIQAKSFDLGDIYQYCNIHFSKGASTEQTLLFLAFTLSFAIKIPMFPLHTWLPDAHVQAPTAGSVILAGVLLKLGIYGFIRFSIPFFPFAAVTFAPYMSILGLIGIIYGAFMCLMQTDMKMLIAYSSISHLGYVVLGLFAFLGYDAATNSRLVYQAVQGAMYQMLNHGVSTGLLFLLVGAVYERRHTKEIAQYGGIAKTMPIYSVIFMITTLSSIGLPGTNGFIGEFLILLGSFKAYPVFGILGALGVVLGAVYMLILFEKVFYGPLTNQKNITLSDINNREILYMVPLIVLIFVMGLYPNFFFQKMDLTLMWSHWIWN